MQVRVTYRGVPGVLIAAIALLLIPLGVVSDSCASAFIDRNVERIRDNDCIDIEFLEKHQPAFNKTVTAVNYQTAEEMAEILAVLYGCDLLAEESKFDPSDERQDGTVYLLWGYMGTKADGSLVTLFDTLRKDKFTITKISPDERLYGTLQEAINSPEMKRCITEYGPGRTKIQAFSLKGVDKGLFEQDGRRVDQIPTPVVLTP